MSGNHNENAADRAYRELREAILNGRLPTQHKVTEAGLAENLGLSRTPVREAVKRLLLEGFLQRRKGQGLWCVVPTMEEMREIFDIRVRLESYAAGRAAIRATDEQRAGLLSSAKRMSVLVARMQDGDDSSLVHQIDRENALFHGTIVEAAHARRLALLLQSTIDVGFVTLTLQRYTREQRLRSANHHHEIANAISMRAAEWAVRAMEVHILAAAATFLKSDDADARFPDDRADCGQGVAED